VKAVDDEWRGDGAFACKTKIQRGKAGREEGKEGGRGNARGKGGTGGGGEKRVDD